MGKVRAITKLVDRLLVGPGKDLPLHAVPGVKERLRAGAKVVRYGAHEGKMRVALSDGGQDVLFDPFLTKTGGLAPYRTASPEAKNLLISKLFRPFVHEAKGTRQTKRYVPVDGEGVIKRARRVTGQQFQDNPALSIGAVGLGGAFIGGVGVEALRGVIQGEERIAQVFDEEMAIRDMVATLSARNSESVLLMQANLQRLAQASPHLYNELAYGMKFAPGETPIGGNPNNQLLNAVAQMMSQGTIR